MAAKTTVDSIKVRMYRHGFGDCFLLSFFHGKKRVFSMLIDCGIKLNTKSKEVPIEDVIEDLKTTLTPASGGKPVIDVLVATHEHWDHVAFFHPEKFPDFFGDFEIGQVWLAWTEDPDDEEAVQINSRLRDGAAALQVAAMQLKATEAVESSRFQGLSGGKQIANARHQFNEALENVLGFYGVAAPKSKSGIKYKPNGKISVNTEEAMEHIVELGQSGGIKYLNPGKTIDKRLLPDGVTVYVLGPPRGSLINKSNPSSGHAHETYFGIDRSGLTSFIDGALSLGASPKHAASTNASQPEHGGPFNPELGVPVTAAQQDPYFNDTYFAASEAYRRIENSWLDVAGQFALQLDGAINNTSLVLAIELEESGKVLLFPGDAQVGSWLSWHDHEWKVKRDGKTTTVSAEDLLNNTVLYKVSHHGSHNATVKDKGLELMTHSDLVAMIPEKEKSYPGILYEPLRTRLNELCKGRVLISADSKFPPQDLVKNRPPELSAAEWKSFKDDLTVDPLYVEYTIR